MLGGPARFAEIIIIITLFKSEGYSAKHESSTNWGDYKSTEIKCLFLRREENRSIREKTGVKCLYGRFQPCLLG